MGSGPAVVTVMAAPHTLQLKLCLQKKCCASLILLPMASVIQVFVSLKVKPISRE
jgi:hypothetical protein